MIATIYAPISRFHSSGSLGHALYMKAIHGGKSKDDAAGLEQPSAPASADAGRAALAA
jgi:hypothetical protein